MSTRTTPWEPGTPCWADLGSPEPTASHAFYAAVLGWQFDDLGAEFGHYSLGRRAGLTVGGIGPLATPGQPAAWTTYLAVDDADKASEQITTHGGTLVVPPMAVGEQGRMAVAVDPTGATFGIWQAGRMIGAQLVNEPGGLIWNDHCSTDPRRARAFYAAVFGFTYTRMDGPADYTTIDGSGPGGVIGGIGELGSDLPGGTGAHWAAYFSVADADVALSTAVSLGARVINGPVETPYGRIATLADPHGALVRLIGAD